MNVAIIGLGKLGAPMAAVAASRGHRIIGVDTAQPTVDALNARRAPVNEPGLASLLMDLPSGMLLATTNLTMAIGATEMAIVIVPTPSGPDGAFLTGAVERVLRDIGPAIQGDFYTVVIASTVMPGDTRGVLRQTLERASGRVLGEGLGLVYSPEFIALGNVITGLEFPDMVMIGSDEPRGAAVYEQYAKMLTGAPIFHASTLEAEIAKLSLNVLLAVKISAGNMVTALCRQLRADPRRVATMMGADTRIGLALLEPGGPFGGPCLPRDTVALREAGRRVGVEMPLTTAAERQNGLCVDAIVAEVGDAERVLVLGMTYKPKTPVTDHSFGLAIARALEARGKRVHLHDPLVKPQPPVTTLLADSDVVIIATPWAEYGITWTGALPVIDPWCLRRVHA